MKLEECSKAELIYFIQRRCFYDKRDLEFEVLMFRSSEISKKASIAAEDSTNALSEYCKLMKPYDGKRIADVPASTLKKAGEAMKRFDSASKQSERYYAQEEKLHKQIDALQRR